MVFRKKYRKLSTTHQIPLKMNPLKKPIPSQNQFSHKTNPPTKPIPSKKHPPSRENARYLQQPNPHRPTEDGLITLLEMQAADSVCAQGQGDEFQQFSSFRYIDDSPDAKGPPRDPSEFQQDPSKIDDATMGQAVARTIGWDPREDMNRGLRQDMNRSHRYRRARLDRRSKAERFLMEVGRIL